MGTTDGSAGPGAGWRAGSGAGSSAPPAGAACPVLAQVHAYWDALRGGRAVPLRSEVDPRGIEAALEFTFILERLAPQVSRFRIAGSVLSDIMGMEVRGMPPTCLFAPEERAEVARHLDRVFADPAVTEMDLVSVAGYGRPQLSGRLLLLPLRSDLGDISRALGCLVPEGQIGRPPRRFGLRDVRHRALTPGPAHIRIVHGAGRTETAEGLAEPVRRYVPAPVPPAPRGRHLRLVKSGA